MKHVSYITKNPKETMSLSEAFSTRMKKGYIITLEGELASGKTTFTKGFGKGLKITDTINSPTFTISKIYEGDFSLIHIDAYRLEDVDQELGFEEYFDEDWMVVIEWPQYIAHLLPNNAIAIDFEVLDETSRKITFNYDEKHASLVEDLV